MLVSVFFQSGFNAWAVEPNDSVFANGGNWHYELAFGAPQHFFVGGRVGFYVNLFVSYALLV
jgi:hypothetical protein